MQALKKTQPETSNGFFEVRLNSIAPGHPLAVDLYLRIGDRPVMFRKIGDVITLERLKQLSRDGATFFLVPGDQRQLYLDSLRSVIRDSDADTETKGKLIKESAFLHIHDLFTKQEIMPVISGAKNLVEDMVSFVSTDVSAVSALMRLSAHDYYTYNHCVDVAVYAIVLAKKVFGEDKNMLMLAGLGGLLHDIGKRQIDWNLINKATPLTPEEWEEIKKHPVYGRDFLRHVASIPEETKQIVYQHHENFDGTGYPQGLTGEQITKLARVVSIADVFDALTTDRSYHKAISPQEALNTMYGMQPGKFDPNIFLAFNKKFTQKPNFLLPKDFDPCSPQDILRKKSR